MLKLTVTVGCRSKQLQESESLNRFEKFWIIDDLIAYCHICTVCILRAKATCSSVTICSEQYAFISASNSAVLIRNTH